ncbi:MAG TPA: purine-nucleoside phosphorylase [Trueperaceae bacterium]
MSQLHIHARSSDVAPFVLLPGDPNRATYIAHNFFDEPRLYNENRQLLGYTGSYKGVPVSVQATGMGCPSLAIVVEELIRLGARTLIRVGTAGIVAKEVRPGDLVIATAAAAADGTTRQYLDGAPSAPHASFEVVEALRSAAGAGSGIHLGPIRTEDAFYATSKEDVARLREQGLLAVEMEASALFLLGQLRGARCGCVLAASNAIGDSSFIDPEVLRRSVGRMTEVALDACLRLHANA